MSAASNGLDLCIRCHDWIEKNRRLAERAGLLVRRGIAEQTSGNAAHPFTDLAGRWWALTDDGEKLPVTR
jgi:hypothetical protein